MASTPAAATVSKASISLLRLSAAAEKAAASADAAKQQVRAAKAVLKKARKVSKAAKKAAKQARKKVAAAQAANRPVESGKAQVPRPKPRRGMTRALAPRRPGSKRQQSAAQVAHSVITRLSAAKPPKPGVGSPAPAYAPAADDASGPTAASDVTCKV